jgi:hypothetical protein
MDRKMIPQRLRCVQVHDSLANAPCANIYREIARGKLIAQDMKRAKKQAQSPRVIKKAVIPAAHEGADAHDWVRKQSETGSESKLYTASAGRRSWKDFFILSTLTVEPRMFEGVLMKRFAANISK